MNSPKGKKRAAVETVTPYSSGENKTAQITRTFNVIAPKYDRLNRILSLGIDLSWRRKALRTLAPQPPQELLDVATGTGDFAMLAAKMFPHTQITGLDLSQAMLDAAAGKISAAGLANRISLCRGDILHSGFSPTSFDAITVAFGVRNFENLLEGLQSMALLLKPGGRLVILELSRPRSPLIGFFYRFYLRVWMPFVGRIVSGHSAEYRYLPASIEVVPQGEAMLSLLAKAGFTSCNFDTYTFGVCSAYFGSCSRRESACIPGKQ